MQNHVPLPNVNDAAIPLETAALEAQLARILAKVPPILRLPPPGTRCPFSQLSRTGLSELVTPTARNGGKPPVQAIYQRAHKYAQRGVWLIPAENLFRYLLNLGTSSVEEYQKAEGLRDPGGDDISPQEEVLNSRNTPGKGKKLPTPPLRRPRTHAKEEWS